MAKAKRSEGNVRAIVAAHDKLVIEVQVLKKKLEDESGDYLRRIKDQKIRVYNLEAEKSKLVDEVLKLQDQINRMSRYIAYNVTKDF